MATRCSTTAGATILVSAISMGLVACGDKQGLVDDGYKGEPLAVINGSLSIEAPEGGGKISIAVAWKSAEWDPSGDENYTPDFVGDADGEVPCDGTPAPYQYETYRENTNAFWALQAAEYEASSLIDFELPILDLPPESARSDLAEMDIVNGEALGEGWMAKGFLIAFLDENGDDLFNRSTPEAEGDPLLASSIFESEDRMYVGQVIYLNGTIVEEAQDHELYGRLEQGFNVVINSYDATTDTDKLVVDLNEPIELFALDSHAEAGLVELLYGVQCSVIEHFVEFNKSFSREDYGDGLECETGAAAATDGGVSALFLTWADAQGEEGAACSLHEMTGAVCFPTEDLPEEWAAFCE